MGHVDQIERLIKGKRGVGWGGGGKGGWRYQREYHIYSPDLTSSNKEKEKSRTEKIHQKAFFLLNLFS